MVKLLYFLQYRQRAWHIVAVQWAYVGCVEFGKGLFCQSEADILWVLWMSSAWWQCCLLVILYFLFPAVAWSCFSLKSMSKAHTWGCWLTSSKGEALTPRLCHVGGTQFLLSPLHSNVLFSHNSLFIQRQAGICETRMRHGRMLHWLQCQSYPLLDQTSFEQVTFISVLRSPGL